ncbi:hypothetical protein RJT34_01217 [Clitoria ternatea]|uniref:Uncharacterized protein n=1 Tax=Clitoria ternatea TaxID=43366 RepID=A0AAN9KGW3_CLITE
MNLPEPSRVSDSLMNLIGTLYVYATICKHEGVPLRSQIYGLTKQVVVKGDDGCWVVNGVLVRAVSGGHERCGWLGGSGVVVVEGFEK